MRSLRIRPIAHSVRILTGGALLAAGTAGCVLPGASAADKWTVVAEAKTRYVCVSECEAGGVGFVSDGTAVSPDHPSGIDYPDPVIGAWERTVAIHCRYVSDEINGRVYQVEVRDKNWKGIWSVYQIYLEEKQQIDDSTFPVCSDSPISES